MIELEEKQRVMVATESDEYVLVKAADIQDVMDQINSQPEWVSGLSWLAEQTGMSRSSLPEKLLYPYREELEDYVDYPDVNGERWRFNVKPLKYWLRTNFTKVNK